MDSEAALRAKAEEHGLDAGLIASASLIGRGVNSISKLAYSITTPGVNPTEDQLRGLVDPSDPGGVTLGALASIRRLVFESQTMSIHQVKMALENTESSKKPELVPAERHARIREQKTRLAGYDLTGPLECSHASYDVVGEMLQKDSVVYLPPTKFGTRSAEVAKDRPPKELIIDSSSHLAVTTGRKEDRCNVNSDLLLSQAFTRRALACDLMGACSFAALEGWHPFLFRHLEHAPPSGYDHVTKEQLLRADKQGWIRLAEILPSIKRLPDGSKPLDAAFAALRTECVIFHLLPLPSTARKPPQSNKRRENAEEIDSGESHGKRRKGAKKGKGKGKGKKGKNFEDRMPSEIKGMKSNTSTGERICWNYNLSNQKCTFASAGGTCKRGKHVCMKCEGAHPQYEHS